jgi:hypothetical protein
VGVRQALGVGGEALAGPDGDVGDRVFVAGEVFGLAQAALEDAGEALGLGRVALDRVGDGPSLYVLGGVAQEVRRLPAHRPEAGHLPGEPLQRDAALARIGGQQAAGLLGQVLQDRAGFEHRVGAAGEGRVVVDDGGQLVVGVDAPELGGVLLALEDVVADQPVGQLQLLSAMLTFWALGVGVKGRSIMGGSGGGGGRIEPRKTRKARTGAPA